MEVCILLMFLVFLIMAIGFVVNLSNSSNSATGVREVPDFIKKYPNMEDAVRHCPCCDSTNITYKRINQGRTRESTGRRGGASIRVCKGVTIRTSSPKSSTTYLNHYVTEGLCKDCGYSWLRDGVTKWYN